MRKAAEIVSAFSAKETLDGRTSFFLVGIGGAGMSALARMLKHRGYEVRGTDSTRSPETDRLQAEGIPVTLGHTGDEIEPKDALIVTDAIELESSPEVARARELGIPMVRRSQALGWLLKSYKVIAITGTHGKTTTTGMTGAGLIAAGLDPLVVVGASIPEWGGPVREGKGEWAVVEACEAYDSFHDLDPHLVVLTNLELDHVDFHGSYENLRSSVVRFAGKRPHSLIYAADDSGATDVAEHVGTPLRAYQPSVEEAKALAAQKEGRTPGRELGESDASYVRRLLRIVGVDVRLPGDHNLKNFSGAVEAGREALAESGVQDPDAVQRLLEGVASFTGAERRLQVLLNGPVTVIDDYAHHPTEIEASLRAIRERYFSGGSRGLEARASHGQDGRATGRLIVVYQPHLYSRTEPLIPEFAQALNFADFVVLTDIYPAREDPIAGVSSARIAELVTRPHAYIPSRHLLPRKIAAMVQEGDIVVGMGAGNIADFAPALIRELERGGMGHPSGSNESARKKIAVAYGGDSAEREVSLHSGRAVYAALKRKGYQAELIDFTELLLNRGDISRLKGPDRPDLVFLAVHGTHAEDGAIQGFLELLHLPYTGSGVQTSAIAMDKDLTKQVLAARSLRVPQGVLLTSPDQPCPIQVPAVVKPNAQGSTVGLSFVDRQEDLAVAIQKAFAYDRGVLVEEWVRGMEISVPVLGDRPLPPVEIAPKSGRYDFASKYLKGATEEIVPARLPQSTLERAQQIAIQAHAALGCKGASRTDMIVPEPYQEQEPVVLEVNTLPGMTATSLLPNSAQAAGISFDDLVEWIVEDALKRHGAKA